MADSQNWPKLAYLVSNPTQQRTLLRVHAETRIEKSETDAIEFRNALDLELARITRREFLAQVAAANYESIAEFKTLLLTSPAFVQYMQFYLYFGLRFAASREVEPCSRGESSPDCNRQLIALPSPPLWQAPWDNRGQPEAFLKIVEADLKAFDENVSHDTRGPVEKALRFLDGFSEDEQNKEVPGDRDSEESSFELWLRRLCFDDRREGYFVDLAKGLVEWARIRFEFYAGLEELNDSKKKWVGNWRENPWRDGVWVANNPLSARCALVDFYWLAKLLRADVSPHGIVTYHDHSWLYFIALRTISDSETSDHQRSDRKATLLRYEEVLRGAFGYACDLIQNAIEVGEASCDPDAATPLPKVRSTPTRPHSWREVLDHENDEIRKQREQRMQDSLPDAAGALKNCGDPPAGWSRRVWNGDQLPNSFGLAFSGGGIRSATFNLGVLQQLQQQDLLRQLDYLSTVSGGGYIGAWLIANVRRSRYWLSRMTYWEKSIEHLRSYSNYLAPTNGLLSPDSWTMWLTWVRNAFLMQVNGWVWLAAMIMAVLSLKQFAFEWVRNAPAKSFDPVLVSLSATEIAIGIIVAILLLRQRYKKSSSVYWVYKSGNLAAIVAALLVWVGSFFTAALLWGDAFRNRFLPQNYSNVLPRAYKDWPIIIGVLYLTALVVWAIITVWLSQPRARSNKPSAIFAFILATIVTPTVAYLALCGQLRLYGILLSAMPPTLCAPSPASDWIVFCLGPAVTVLLMAISVVVFIGLIGKDAHEWTREWWTRYGAWIALVGAASLLFAGVAVGAPYGILALAQVKLQWKTIAAAVGWAGSTVAGLLAGNSSKTGEGSDRSMLLEIVARMGAIIFIAGAVSLGSTLVYLILENALTTSPPQYGNTLQEIVNATFFDHVHGICILAICTTFLAWILSRRFDLNSFSLNEFYRDRLVRCYLGATRWQPGMRHPHPFTAFDGSDDIGLSRFRADDHGFCGSDEGFRGPFPIVNCTLNLGGSSDLAVHTRQGASFILTPLFCGASRNAVGYVKTQANAKQQYAGEVTLGQAISISGAAASANMGYNTSPLVSFMMTLFNVRLGWWFPNPRYPDGYQDKPPGEQCLFRELFGLADEKGSFINVSDGGHFENLGVYELIRRRVRVIIAADAECDEDLTFGSLGNLIRICETDFGAKIDLDVSSIRKQELNQFSRAHCAVGRITYSNGARGYLIYIKASITGDEDIGVAQYQSGHPSFPHESTGNQFYSEDQFEAYRRLGYHTSERTFRDAKDETTPFDIAAKLYDVWAPAGFSTAAFLEHAKTFEKLWDHFRTEAELDHLFAEIMTGKTAGGLLSRQELAASMELLQFMENVFLDLRLDDFWDHPDNRGWAMLFTSFARSRKFRESWKTAHSTYGIRFEYFCSRHLGLERDHPVMRL